MRKLIIDYRSPPSGVGTVFREDGNEIDIPYPPAYYEPDEVTHDNYTKWVVARLREYGVTHVVDTEYGVNFEDGKHQLGDLFEPIPLEDWVVTISGANSSPG